MLKKPTEKHHAFRNDAIELLRKYSGDLDGADMLALASHLVGQIIAAMDQRTMDQKRAMEIVIANIEQGNKEAIAIIKNTVAGSA